MKNLDKLDNPLNIDERYLHAINIRLNILIEMFSSFLDVYANQNEVAATSNEVVEDKFDTEIPGQIVMEEKDDEGLDYTQLTKAEIQKNLDILGINYNSRMTKSELIELLD